MYARERTRVLLGGEGGGCFLRKFEGLALRCVNCKRRGVGRELWETAEGRGQARSYVTSGLFCVYPPASYRAVYMALRRKGETNQCAPPTPLAISLPTLYARLARRYRHWTFMRFVVRAYDPLCNC